MTNTSKEVRANKRAENAPKRAATLQMIEHIVIAVLITAVAAFLFGMKYQHNVDAQKAQAVSSAVSQLKVKQ